MKNIITLVVDSEFEGKRIDVFIANKNEDLSRTRVKNLIINGNLNINNQLVKDPSKKIFALDRIKIMIPEPKKASLKPFKYKLNIVHEDDDLLVIDKLAGISMHPGAGNYDNTIVNALMDLDYKNLSTIGDEFRPGIVHRIDKDTSGLIVIAKNNKTHEDLSKQFSDHTITRLYQTLICGKLRPQNGIIETLITRSSKNRQLMEVGATKGKKQLQTTKP